MWQIPQALELGLGDRKRVRGSAQGKLSETNTHPSQNTTASFAIVVNACSTLVASLALASK